MLALTARVATADPLDLDAIASSALAASPLVFNYVPILRQDRSPVGSVRTRTFTLSLTAFERPGPPQVPSSLPARPLPASAGGPSAVGVGMPISGGFEAEFGLEVQFAHLELDEAALERAMADMPEFALRVADLLTQIADAPLDLAELLNRLLRRGDIDWDAILRRRATLQASRKPPIDASNEPVYEDEDDPEQIKAHMVRRVVRSVLKIFLGIVLGLILWLFVRRL